MTVASLDIAAPPPTARPRNRLFTLAWSGLALGTILGVVAAALAFGPRGLAPNFDARLAAPDLAHWFGTDQFGRDMLARTIHGLSLSLWVGLAAAGLSTIIATTLALVATATGRLGDAVVSLLLDAVMGLPHLVLLILICFALGGGTGAVIAAVAVTHWPRLTRILRAEILQLRDADFIMVSRRLGRSRLHIAIHHLLPHLLPQMLVGFVLLFPHAILHEAGLTFLGFGLEPTSPAIGVLLSDAMRYLMAGKWWLGLFPGLCLLALVLCFEAVGNGLRALLDPRRGQL